MVPMFAVLLLRHEMRNPPTSPFDLQCKNLLPSEAKYAAQLREGYHAFKDFLIGVVMQYRVNLYLDGLGKTGPPFDDGCLNDISKLLFECRHYGVSPNVLMVFAIPSPSRQALFRFMLYLGMLSD